MKDGTKSLKADGQNKTGDFNKAVDAKNAPAKRKAAINRKTTETDIKLSLSIDGGGAFKGSSGSGFLDHMLRLFSSHGRFDIELLCGGDFEVGLHHVAEDIGISLGEAFLSALGDKKGIKRYGSVILPMDEALILCAADFSGRSYLSYKIRLNQAKIGEFDTELVKEFFLGFVRAASLTLHIKQLEGGNTHHVIEGVFKAFARALRQATEADAAFFDEVPSTKGVL